MHFELLKTLLRNSPNKNPGWPYSTREINLWPIINHNKLIASYPRHCVQTLAVRIWWLIFTCFFSYNVLPESMLTVTGALSSAVSWPLPGTVRDIICLPFPIGQVTLNSTGKKKEHCNNYSHGVYATVNMDVLESNQKPN